jgi:hypothetical protein
MNLYGCCYAENSNLKHVPLVNISGFTAVLILCISPGDNDLSARQRALFTDMKNQKFKEHNNKPNTCDEKKKITKYKRVDTNLVLKVFTRM